MKRPVVIGFGNSLRGDDGVGPAVAAAVAARAPNIYAVSVPMLMPEHVALLRDASVVVFVDACVATPPGHVQVTPLDGETSTGAFGHLLSAAVLVGLSQLLDASTAPAYQVRVGVEGFGVGEAFSARVAAAVEIAAASVVDVVMQAASSP